MQATHPAVLEYLRAFELEIKQKHGVRPEEAISDAREFLLNELESIKGGPPSLSRTLPSQQEITDHFVRTFGAPDEVANEYASKAGPIGKERRGYAPGWRICCTKCGIGTTAAKAGITRVWARSVHKYVLGYCRNCGGFRSMRLIRDLELTNISDGIRLEESSEDFRARMHWPLVTVMLILVGIFITLAVAFSFLGLLSNSASGAEVKVPLPPNWQQVRRIEANAQQVQAVGRKLGVDAKSISKTIYRTPKGDFQINEITCGSEEEAEKVRKVVNQNAGFRGAASRKGTRVRELSCKDVALGIRAWQELIQPKEVRYKISFDAAPITKCNPTTWNRVFNLFVQVENETITQTQRQEIAELTREFRFGSRLPLRVTGIGSQSAEWSFQQSPTTKVVTPPVTTYEFRDLPRRENVPYVTVSGRVSSQTFSRPHAIENLDKQRLTAPTKHWPVESPTIQQLAKTITVGAETDKTRVEAIYAWHRNRNNIRFDGEVTGSRYGVERVLNQKFGHCCDYADTFITLCRASGVPSRMMLGWLHDGGGHVWAEVLINGHWIQIDPTGVRECGSNYIPIATIEDGEFPLLYVSNVSIEVLDRR